MQEQGIRKRLLIVNVLVLAIGVIFIIVGALSLIYDEKYTILLNMREFEISSILLLVTGILTILVSIFGIFTHKHYTNRRFIAFVYFLVLILLLAILAGSLGSMWKTRRFHELMEDNICDVRVKFGRDVKVTDYINRAQKELECCGSTSYFDYVGSYWWWKHGNGKWAVPLSCCVNPSASQHCNQGVPRAADILITDSIHTKGCTTTIREFITERISTLAGTAFGLAFLLFFCLLGLLLSSYLEREGRELGQVTSQEGSLTSLADNSSPSGDGIKEISSSTHQTLPKEKVIPPVKPPRPSLGRVPERTKGNPRQLIIVKRDGIGQRIKKLL